MGFAMVSSALKSKIYQPNQIYILEKKRERVEFLRQHLGCVVEDQWQNFALIPATILLAIKPQNYQEVLKGFPPEAFAKKKIVSILAGVRVESLQQIFPYSKIARVMPNTPAALGAGASVYYAPNWSDEEKQPLANLLKSLGQALEVHQEDKINQSVGISGSGPGFIFYLASVFLKQALELGFSEQEANLLTRQTFYGAGVMLKEFPHKSIGQLEKEVTSPNGATFAGLEEFKKLGLEKILQAGLQKSIARARELGG